MNRRLGGLILVGALVACGQQARAVEAPVSGAGEGPWRMCVYPSQAIHAGLSLQRDFIKGMAALSKFQPVHCLYTTQLEAYDPAQHEATFTESATAELLQAVGRNPEESGDMLLDQRPFTLDMASLHRTTAGVFLRPISERWSNTLVAYASLADGRLHIRWVNGQGGGDPLILKALDASNARFMQTKGKQH